MNNHISFLIFPPLLFSPTFSLFSYFISFFDMYIPLGQEAHTEKMYKAYENKLAHMER